MLKLYFKSPSSSIVLISTLTNLDNFFLTHLDLSVCSMFCLNFFLAYILTTLNKKILVQFLESSLTRPRAQDFLQVLSLLPKVSHVLKLSNLITCLTFWQKEAWLGFGGYKIT